MKNNKLINRILPKKKNNNSIFTIHPYKWFDEWVFDDDRMGLVKEAFVAGADTFLDKLTGGKEEATVLFSTNRFPTAEVEITLRRTDETGSDYWCEKYKHELWLCPALFLYYPTAPQTIFLQVKTK